MIFLGRGVEVGFVVIRETAFVVKRELALLLAQ